MDREEILQWAENMSPGLRATLEKKLSERGEILTDLCQVNNKICIGSPLERKGPLYWNAIFVEKDGQRKMYRICAYISL